MDEDDVMGVVEFLSRGQLLKSLIPDASIYRVRLLLVEAGETPVPQRGEVHMQGERRSALGRALRAVAAVLIREWGA